MAYEVFVHLTDKGDEEIYSSIKKLKIQNYAQWMLVDTRNVEKTEEYNVVPINFLFTNVSPYGPPPQEDTVGCVKNSLTQAKNNTFFFLL